MNKALRESEERYRNLIEGTCDMIQSVRPDGSFIFANQAWLKTMGYSEDELSELNLFDIIHPESLPHCKEVLYKILAGESLRSVESIFVTKDKREIIVEGNVTPHYSGSQVVGIQCILRESMLLPIGEKWFEVIVDPIFNTSEHLIGAVHIISDVTERKQAEAQLKASLKEKELLLLEIHHRVKNNLQVISSLLDMSSMRIHEQRAIDLLNDARDKIHSMALIHLQLYQSERFDQIEMGNHVRELVSYLSSLYATGKSITSVIEISDVYLSITQAIPCALVLNELISNAFKHAFKERQKGTIEISMQKLAE